MVKMYAKVIFIDNKEGQVIKEIGLTSPLIGVYQIDDNKMLVWEETYIRTVNSYGEIVQDMTTDLIDDFNIQDDVLYVFADNNKYTYKL